MKRIVKVPAIFPGPVTALTQTALASLCLALLLPLSVLAQDDLERPPEIPPEGTAEQPLPPKVQDEQIEPTVTIRDEEGKRIEEYSRNGQVYMVKVTPDKGVPYYYIDSDGDGRLETSPTKDLEQVRPVYWKVKEWD
ncbi:MAG TPA: DUF2782 domain-containing protein [Xanthomonadales bacterium]|nr:DUF2782 domain-containing protein [Xanthomonadales bacterium]